MKLSARQLISDSITAIRAKLLDVGYGTLVNRRLVYEYFNFFFLSATKQRARPKLMEFGPILGRRIVATKIQIYTI
jgi:hypothetical protein